MGSGLMIPRLISGASGGSQGDQERVKEGKGSQRVSHGASVAGRRSQYEDQYGRGRDEETEYDRWSREDTRGSREEGRGDVGSGSGSWGPRAGRQPWRD